MPPKPPPPLQTSNPQPKPKPKRHQPGRIKPRNPLHSQHATHRGSEHVIPTRPDQRQPLPRDHPFRTPAGFIEAVAPRLHMESAADRKLLRTYVHLTLGGLAVADEAAVQCEMLVLLLLLMLSFSPSCFLVSIDTC
jgi:hypothetical protein